MDAITDTLGAIWAAARSAPLLITGAALGGLWIALRRR